MSGPVTVYVKTENLCFVHVYKTGGTSIYQALRHLFVCKALIQLRRRKLDKFYAERIAGNALLWNGHPKAVEIRDYILPSTIIFAVVSHPCTWLLSLFYQRKKSRKNFNCQIKGAKDENFSEFIRACILNASLPDYNSFLDFPNNPVHILRFESLTSDFEYIRRHLDYRVPALEHLNRSSKPTDMCSISHETRDLIMEHYKLFMDKYGY